VPARLIAACTVAAFGASVLGGCGFFGDDVTEPARTAPATLVLTSPAFEDGGTVPQRYTCTGRNESPPLQWSGVPDDAGSLALVVTDPDAPGGTYVHWIVFNLDKGGPVAARRIAAGRDAAGAQQRRARRVRRPVPAERHASLPVHRLRPPLRDHAGQRDRHHPGAGRDRRQGHRPRHLGGHGHLPLKSRTILAGGVDNGSRPDYLTL